VESTSVTVGVAVTDLVASRRWYEAVFEIAGPDLEPVEGVVEYQIGDCWLQLGEAPGGPGGWVFRVGVADVRKERARLLGLGVRVEPVVTIEGVIEFCDFCDPDGNRLSLYTVGRRAEGSGGVGKNRVTSRHGLRVSGRPVWEFPRLGGPWSGVVLAAPGANFGVGGGVVLLAYLAEVCRFRWPSRLRMVCRLTPALTSSVAWV